MPGIKGHKGLLVIFAEMLLCALLLSIGSTRVRADPVDVVLGVGQSPVMGNEGICPNGPRGNECGDESGDWLPLLPTPRGRGLMLDTGERIVPPIEKTPVLDCANVHHIRPIAASMFWSDMRGMFGETPGIGFTDGLPDPTLWIVSGQGGTASTRARGSVVYDNSLTAIRCVMALRPEGVVVRALIAVEGESDASEDTTDDDFAADMVERQKSYTTDILAITHQDIAPFLLMSQDASYGMEKFYRIHPHRVTGVNQGMYQAEQQRPGKIVLVMPRYFLPYGPDGIHLTPQGTRLLGEYYQKAYLALTGTPRSVWRPVEPTKVYLVGNVIHIDYYVPVQPLVFDTTTVSNPGNYGFEAWDDTGPLGFTKIDLRQSDSHRSTVLLYLDRTPKTGAQVAAAWTAKIGAHAGPDTGPRSNVRDSDPTRSALDGRALWNWGVSFHAWISPTPSATATAIRTVTASPTRTAKPTRTATATRTATRSATRTATITPTRTVTRTASRTATQTPTATATPRACYANPNCN